MQANPTRIDMIEVGDAPVAQVRVPDAVHPAAPKALTTAQKAWVTRKARLARAAHEDHGWWSSIETSTQLEQQASQLLYVKGLASKVESTILASKVEFA